MCLFFFAKNAFFFAFFGQNHYTKVRLKIAFLDRVTEHKHILVVVVRASSTNEPLFFSTRKRTTTFLRRRETTTKKSADVHEVLGVFVGSVSGEERPVFFKNLCAFFSEREREREREISKKI